MVTAAFATGDPDGVVTVPEKLPPVACAHIVGKQANKKYMRSFETLLDMKLAPNPLIWRLPTGIRNFCAASNNDRKKGLESCRSTPCCGVESHRRHLRSRRFHIM